MPRQNNVFLFHFSPRSKHTESQQSPKWTDTEQERPAFDALYTLYFYNQMSNNGLETFEVFCSP